MGRIGERFRRGTDESQKPEEQKWSIEARIEGVQKFIFVSLMDICHLKNAELETKHQKYKGQVVLRD